MISRLLKDVLLLCVAALLAANLFLSGAREAKAQSYTQYSVINASGAGMEKELNAKAKQGWRVVSMAPQWEQSGGGGRFWIVLGK